MKPLSNSLGMYVYEPLEMQPNQDKKEDYHYTPTENLDKTAQPISLRRRYANAARGFNALQKWVICIKYPRAASRN